MMDTAMEPTPIIKTIIKPTTTKATTMTGMSLDLLESKHKTQLIGVNSGYYAADGQVPYQQDAYYDGNQGYQDEYYDGQYYDQGAPAQQGQYSQGGYGCVQTGSE